MSHRRSPIIFDYFYSFPCHLNSILIFYGISLVNNLMKERSFDVLKSPIRIGKKDESPFLAPFLLEKSNISIFFSNWLKSKNILNSFTIQLNTENFSSFLRRNKKSCFLLLLLNNNKNFITDIEIKNAIFFLHFFIIRIYEISFCACRNEINLSWRELYCFILSSFSSIQLFLWSQPFFENERKWKLLFFF